MRALSKAMPGWVGRELLPLGVRPAMSLLASGWLTMRREGCFTREEAEQEIERVCMHYEGLANSWDPVGDLHRMWEAFSEARPWVRRNDVVAPFQDLQSVDEAKVAAAAEMLSKLDLDYLAVVSDGDPLGAVHAEIGAQARRQAVPIDQGDLIVYAMKDVAGMLQTGVHESARSFTDLWCGSGRRMVGRGAALRLMGRDPASYRWELSDPNPVLLACAAVNLDYYAHGDKIVMYVNEEHAQAWLAAAAAHRVPVTPFQAAHMDRVTEMMRD